MKTKTSTKSIIGLVRARKAGTALVALASVIPLVLAANASQKPAAAARQLGTGGEGRGRSLDTFN